MTPSLSSRKKPGHRSWNHICLATAHARTGDSASISGYIGNGKALASGITEFAVAYADQAERDHQALVEAIESGRVIAEEGI